MKRLILMAAAAGCATQAPAEPSSPTHRIAWSTVGTNDDGLGPIACGTAISHPCPWQLFTHLATIFPADAGALDVTWWDASGGTDANGFPASHHVPEDEVATLTAAGDIELADRGDDGGDRNVSTLTATATGYEGDVTWQLFNVAGRTSFHLVIEGVVAPVAP